MKNFFILTGGFGLVTEQPGVSRNDERGVIIDGGDVAQPEATARLIFAAIVA
jgi:hypothetical protein